MQDSRANRRKVIRWLSSRGGEHRSGRYDNLFSYLFRQIFSEKYKHGAVSALRKMIDAMERDGQLSVEKADNGKAVAIRLI